MKNLVDYDSSSDSDNNFEEPTRKKAKKAPLPMLLEVDSKKKLKIDNPDEHQNRIRTIPHVEGNWASHVFIELQGPELRLTDDLQRLEINRIETPHLSLSRTFILKYHWLENFFKSLKSELSKSSCFSLQLTPSLIYLSNDDNSRFFACILVDENCHSELGDLIKKVDSCLSEFNLPVYYETPLFHVSLFWKLKEFSEEEKDLLAKMIAESITPENQITITPVDKIKCKSGNKLIEISLK